MYDWMGDETSNEALCQCRVGVISKGLSNPFGAFLGSLTIEWHEGVGLGLIPAPKAGPRKGRTAAGA